MILRTKLLLELQKRLKVGSRKGVHLNSIPANSKYKFDINRLRNIEEILPDKFIRTLLSQKSFNFKIGWDKLEKDLNTLSADDHVHLLKVNRSLEDLFNQIEAIESEKGLNSFGFGYPLLVRRDLADKKIIVAPIFIWSLRIKRSKELNTWEISRAEDDSISVSEVLINHLESDTKIIIDQLHSEIVERGIITETEVVDYCLKLTKAINGSIKEETKNIFEEKLTHVHSIKDKKHYEALPLPSNTSYIEFAGLFSIFEVQKQNIIENYESIIKLGESQIELSDMNNSIFQQISSIETDPSQQSILNLLDRKRNILIQGPPGTGKSQSLTAIIVNALENKKKTIVVCEKYTALEVLKNALGKRDLSKHTALIKDIVKDRTEVVNSVRDRLENRDFKTIPKPNEILLQLIKQINAYVASINNKHKKLAEPIFNNKIWSDIVGDLLKALKISPEQEIDLSQITFNYNPGEIEEVIELLKTSKRLYENYIPYKSNSFLNPDKFIGNNEFEIEANYKADYLLYKNEFKQFEKLIAEYKEAYKKKRILEFNSEVLEINKLKQLIKLKEDYTTLETKFKIDYKNYKLNIIIKEITKIETSIEAIEESINLFSIDPDFLDEKKTNSALFKIMDLFSSKGKKINLKRDQLIEQYKDLEMLSNNVEGLIPFVSSSSISTNIQRNTIFTLKVKERFSIKNEFFEDQYHLINFLNNDIVGFTNISFSNLKECLSKILAVLPEIKNQNDLSENLNIHIHKVIDKLNDIKFLGTTDNNISFIKNLSISPLNEIFISNLEMELGNLNGLSEEQNQFNLKEFDIIKEFVKNLNFKINYDGWYKIELTTTEHATLINQFNDLIDLNDKYKSHNENLFKIEYEWFNYYNNLLINHKKLIDIIKLQENWINSFIVFYLNSILQKSATKDLPTDDIIHTDLRNSLNDFEKKQINFINSLWSYKQSNATINFETKNKDFSVENLYNKRQSTKHKRLSLRQIVETDLDLFTTFFPVILTTPEVCSNLFKKSNNYFDFVVFDEASQLRLEDNLPAILKAKQIIIAGDEHQMPPSNYFSKVFDGTIEDEEEIEEDEEDKPILDKDEILLSCESLLEFGAEMNFQKQFLDFHYRSEHPYLIDFSNYAFYQQRLVPLPNKVEYNPFMYIQVNGTFSEHTNEREAEAVLKVLEFNIQRLQNGKYPSVGIATFNIGQRNLIKSKLIERQKFSTDSDFCQKIQELEKSGLFVKNLENIQGDERDIIILSTTYGINKDGKFNQRFGPINQSKGYKLLNVIVTRAKYKVFVCTSVPEEVFLNYKEHLITQPNNGKSYFFTYLAYAKAVSDGNEELRCQILETLSEISNVGKKLDISNHQLESPFEEEVYRDLLLHFPSEKIIPQFKYAGFRIDMVFDPKIPGKPRIAIECDGAKFHSSDEAYLHDIYRQKILEDNGFVFHRIWSTNWWRNPKREIDQLVNFINKNNI